MLTALKLFLINIIEVIMAALLGGLVIALADHFMKYKVPSDTPFWKDYLGRMLYYAGIIWFHIYACALFVLFFIIACVMRMNQLSHKTILIISLLLFALIAAVIWQEAYSYSGTEKIEKRLKNTISLLVAGVLFSYYTNWLSKKSWTQFSFEEPEDTVI